MFIRVLRLAGFALAAILAITVPLTAGAAEPGKTSHSAAATGQVRDGDKPIDTVKSGNSSASDASQTEYTRPRPRWEYHILSSCKHYSAEIRKGANYWGGGVQTKSGGTSVGCVDHLRCDGDRVAGCNKGGTEILLNTDPIAKDFVLLAAHEFGHNWYGHSGPGSQDWSSPAAVMRAGDGA
ncbi:hypothetical protein [Streptomyces cucumeris]|uniref:hypothetical protein n=1 Tax=Streptomyces cucumeris TaxID=2962890 RepID=UPI003D721D73